MHNETIRLPLLNVLLFMCMTHSLAPQRLFPKQVLVVAWQARMPAETTTCLHSQDVRWQHAAAALESWLLNRFAGDA